MASELKLDEPQPRQAYFVDFNMTSKHWKVLAIVIGGLFALTVGVSGSVGLSYLNNLITVPQSWFTTVIHFVGNTPHFWFVMGSDHWKFCFKCRCRILCLQSASHFTDL